LVDTWRSEDRNNPRNSGNAKAENNVYLLHSFFLCKKEKVAKTTGHKIYSDVASTGKKEGFLS